jgi:hypothetical protein
MEPLIKIASGANSFAIDCGSAASKAFLNCSTTENACSRGPAGAGLTNSKVINETLKNFIISSSSKRNEPWSQTTRKCSIIFATSHNLDRGLLFRTIHLGQVMLVLTIPDALPVKREIFGIASAGSEI